MNTTCSNQTFTKSIQHFDEFVVQGLQTAGVGSLSQIKRLGVAVSGGADSLSLLIALCHIAVHYHFSLYVITIDHRIRSEEESAGDAHFVVDVCKLLEKQGYPVQCVIHTFEPGKVFSVSQKRGRGIEEAARFLRYHEFEIFALEHQLPYICLAHNQNDQLETLLMRFLQGSTASGISTHRDLFVRPLLSISRAQIESYLTELHQPWRTDISNQDNHYLRNKIRNQLMPFLNEIFAGWQHAVLSGAEKARADTTYIEAVVEDACDNIHLLLNKNTMAFDANTFYTLDIAIRRRMLYRFFNTFGYDDRIPYSIISQVLGWQPDQEKSIFFSEIEIQLHDRTIFIKKQSKTATQHTFFAILNKQEDFADLKIEEAYTEYVTRVGYPCCIRSRQPDDLILCADGSYKALNDIYASWHVPEESRDDILLIQELSSPEQRICCICGKLAGYEDWIVK